MTSKTALADPADTQNLDDFLCFALYSTNLVLNRLNKSVLDKLGLTYLQYVVLVALYEEDDRTVSGLGDQLFLDSSTLTPLLKKLEAVGHLTRQRDPHDERQVRLRITSKGRKVREQALAFRGDQVDAMGFDAVEFKGLREQLLKLRANLLNSMPTWP